MAIQNWEEDILVVELSDDPQFTDDLDSLMDRLEAKVENVVLNFAAVGFINSSNVAKLLRLRKKMGGSDKNLVLTDINTQVWGIFMVTGLDKIFDFTNDIATALAKVQIANGGVK